MAATNSTLAAGKALAGQGGNGKDGNKGRAAALVATTALGLSLVVGGLLGQGRQAEHAAAPPANPFAGDTHVPTVWDYREDRRAETRDLSVVDPFTYREDRRVGASDLFFPDQFTYREDRRGEHLASPVPGTTERQRFLEDNLWLPTGTLPAISIEERRFLELNTQLPDGGAARPPSYAELWFLEQNQLPEGPRPWPNASGLR